MFNRIYHPHVRFIASVMTKLSLIIFERERERTYFSENSTYFLDASFIILDMLFVLSSRWLCNVSRVTINRRRKLCAMRLDPHAYSNLDCCIPCVHRPSPKSNVFRLRRFIAPLPSLTFMRDLYRLM